jgi:flagellar biosynthetic protein FlhB
MADESQDDKTEPATPRKIEMARSEGRVLKSQEVNAAAMVGASMLIMAFWAPLFLRKISALAWAIHGNAGGLELTTTSVYTYFVTGLEHLGLLMLPLIVPLVVVAVGANVMQIGFLLSGKALLPKLEKLNPISGIKRLFSAQGAAELVKSLLKIFAIATVGVLTIRARFDDLIAASESVGLLLATIGDVTLHLGIHVALALVVIAIADYLFQRWQFLRSLRMTKKEVTEEQKQSEGDPHVKGKLRGLMRQMSRRRMLTDTASADVVVTNPVHVAVALRYDTARSGAPIVVAKGMRRLAEKIKAVAREADVPIVENPPVARQLYKLVDVGDAIPSSLFKAVAEILAFVYRLRGRRVS